MGWRRGARRWRARRDGRRALRRPVEPVVPRRGDRAARQRGARRASRPPAPTRSTQLDDEVTAAAGLPQLRAALGDKVDTSTMEDLLETERWWEPYRARAAAVIGPHGPLATRNVGRRRPGGRRAAGAGRARPRRRAAASAWATVPSSRPPRLIDVEDLPPWTLVARAPARPRAARLSGRSARTRAWCLSDGHRASLRDSGAARPTRLVGHEAETLIVDAAGGLGGDPGGAGARACGSGACGPLPPELAKDGPLGAAGSSWPARSALAALASGSRAAAAEAAARRCGPDRSRWPTAAELVARFAARRSLGAGAGRRARRRFRASTPSPRERRRQPDQRRHAHDDRAAARRRSSAATP